MKPGDGTWPTPIDKAPREPPGLISPSNERITVNSTICLLNVCTAEGFEI